MECAGVLTRPLGRVRWDTAVARLVLAAGRQPPPPPPGSQPAVPLELTACCLPSALGGVCFPAGWTTIPVCAYVVNVKNAAAADKDGLLQASGRAGLAHPCCAADRLPTQTQTEENSQLLRMRHSAGAS